MAYENFWHNGEILPVSQAVVPLSSIEYSYGFGVYETIRISKGKALFLDEHVNRLMGSARIIRLAHNLSAGPIAKGAQELIDRNKIDSCNLKLLLVGGAAAEGADLYMLCLNPHFPDRQLYKQGVHTITKEVERPFPHAKTLNMLPSYLARRDARDAGAYEALLTNRHGHITEGTSTNFFALKGRLILSPPESDILPGITRDKVSAVAGKMGFELQQRDIKADEISQYDSLFLTGTAVKIMPVRSVGKLTIGPPPPALLELMLAFDEFLAAARAQA